MSVVNERIKALQKLMAEAGFDYFIIPSADEHLDEYVEEYWHARAYFSGFTGSAGTVIVSANGADLWVDGRYHLQGEAQTKDTIVTLHKDGLPDVPTIKEWLSANVRDGQVVAYDGRTVGLGTGKAWQALLPHTKFVTDVDLVSRVWTDRPAVSCSKVSAMDVAYTGQTCPDKLARIRTHLREQKHDMILVSNLSHVAWISNLRGRDVLYTPVFYGYLVIDADEAVLFTDASRFENTAVPAGLTLAPYESLEAWLGEHADVTKKVEIDPEYTNMKLYTFMKDKYTLVEEAGIAGTMASYKNATEQAAIREAHVLDGVAVTKFICWMQKRAEACKDDAYITDENGEVITEYSLDEELTAMRLEQGAFELSFDTIAGYADNGAVIHYSAKKETAKKLSPRGLLVLDSGGQYPCGTTDVTRTLALGPISAEEKRMYTLVLKGHLALSRTLFPEGTTGSMLDILARQPLWDDGKNFRHGTGHGVGHVLSVHDGHERIAAVPNTFPIKEGVLISNEPGYYEAGAFGVRIENLCLAQPAMETEYGKFLRLEAITLIPYEKRAIDWSLLTSEEKAQLRDFNAKIAAQIRPRLNASEQAWLDGELTIPD